RGSEAVARVTEMQPLAVLLDVLMPNKDGWQVLAELKQSDDTHDIPVIMATLVTETDRALEMGAFDYLTKPILEADLLGVLRRLPAPAPQAPQVPAEAAPVPPPVPAVPQAPPAGS